MKRLTIPSILSLGLVASLSTDYSAERSLRVECETEFSMETTDSTVEINGEPREGRGLGGGSSETRKVVMIDKVLSHEDGTPTAVQRTFESLEGSGTMTMRDTEREIQRDTPLNGVVLKIEGDEVEVVEGAEPENEEFLKGHKMTLALDAFLPEEAVEEGDSWEIDSKVVAHALGVDLEAQLFPRPQREAREGGMRGEGGGGGRRGGMRGGRGGGGLGQLFTSGEWEAKATLVSLSEEHESGPVAKVELELKSTGELAEREGRGGMRGGDRMPEFGIELPKAPVENSFTIELEGHFFFSTKERRPVALEVEGTIATERTMERQTERGDFYMHTAQEGKFKHVVNVSVVEDSEEQ